MWFNSSHTHQYAFDRVAGEYDLARARFDLALVAKLAAVAELAPGDPVYEVGAGTGQLTRGLLEFGFSVTANEPGDKMREQLEQLESDYLDIDDSPFETAVVLEHSQAAVFAANSFHWIQPEIAFRKVNEIVGPGGSLCLLWNFAFLEPRVQDQLNNSAFANYDELSQSLDLGLDAFEGVMAAGRDLIASSGLFERPWHDWQPVTRELAPENYADLAVSYASTAALPDEERVELRANIAADLSALDLDSVTITDHVYSCVARAI